MHRPARGWRFAAALLVVAVPGVLGSTVSAQLPADEFVTGQAAIAWQKWQAAMQALLDRKHDEAETAMGELLALKPSAFRIALLADRSVSRNEKAGGVLALELDSEAGLLKDNGKRVAELLVTGREQMNQADDGWYFCSIGRFDVAQANFAALLASDPDPVALLEMTDRVPRRHEILNQLSDHPLVGEAARGVLSLLLEGERQIKADPIRVQENIAKLAGPPRAFEAALARLKESGEYAVPFMVEVLRDPKQTELLRPVLRALPALGRAGLNPLVVALRMDDAGVVTYLAEAAGEIGYFQSLPYLLQIREARETSAEVRTAVEKALASLPGASGGPSAASAFLRLAEMYYSNDAEVAADPRLATANVWYWREDILQNVVVPTVIFDEIMCMRCCEESLRQDPAAREALALWLAANFRREAQLPEGATDATRPDNVPSAAYFAQSAGAEYCLMALDRAVQNGEASVALGAIEALRKTAGPASLEMASSQALPLAKALSFPDRMVRVRAGLALAAGMPMKKFQNDQNLMPVLNEALLLFGGARNALVVDADSSAANATLAAVRQIGFEAISAEALFAGLEKARKDLPGLDLIIVPSDSAAPAVEDGIAQLRSEFRFAAVPVLIVTKPGDQSRIETLARKAPGVVSVPVGADSSAIEIAIRQASKAVGATAVTPEVGSGIAMEAASVLRRLALTNNPVLDLAAAQGSLIKVLQDKANPDLRMLAAEVLGYLATAEAQGAIASRALDVAEEAPMRMAMFAALAEAAKREGNHLSGELVAEVIKLVESEPNLELRTAASQALGALNLESNPASTIIRNQYGG